MKHILAIGPTAIDRREFSRPEIRSQYHITESGHYERDHPERLDALRYIDDTVSALRGQQVDGIFSSHDYPGAVLAVAIANRLGLPSPDVDTVLRTQHKFYARRDQRQYVPEATPEYVLLDPNQRAFPGLQYPMFVKPVKSFFSILAADIHSEPQLKSLLHSRAARHHVKQFVQPFNRLMGEYCSLPYNGSYFIGEQKLRGIQVTLEGYATDTDVFIFGIVDSVMYPGTISFARFEYPSQLPRRIQERMQSIAKRLIRGIGFRWSLFNIEFFYNPGDDSVYIIELNTRMASQFSDLYERVDGTSSYSVAMDVATGQAPSFVYGNGQHAVAASFVLRTFEDKLVRSMPSREDLEALAHEFPDAIFTPSVRVGERLSDHLQDVASFKYGTLHLGGTSRSDLFQRYRRALELLPFEFEAV